MPLPFGGKPEDSAIYNDLKTKKLSELDPDEFSKIQARTFAEGINGTEDEYRRLLLLGLASDKLSLAGPMRDVEVAQITQTSDVGFYDIFKPTYGVWQFLGGDMVASGGTGAVNFSLTNGSESVYIGSTSVSGQEPLTFDNLYKLPALYITPELWIGGDATSIATSTRVTMAFIRVR